MTDTNSALTDAHLEQALPIGTNLSGNQFTITGHIGAGGFGITYHAKDNVLGRPIVLKECFPVDFCVREGKDVYARNQSYQEQIRSIVKMFMREARSLAKLRHPNIVGVHRAFEENGTAYMVLDLIDGQDLFDILDKNWRLLSPGRIKTILLQILDAIEKVHEMGLLHRDISPDNIIIEKNGTPVLIDFGAARADASRHTRAVSSFLVVKDGYSPQEFYVAGSSQGPSSDLYALAATFYHLLSGRAPVNSQKRMMEVAGNRPDPCPPLEGRIPGYDAEFLRAIDMAMIIHPDERMQSAAKWRSMIADSEVDDSAAPNTKISASGKDVSLELELELSRLVEETNNEVRRSSMIPKEPVIEAEPEAKPTSKPAWVDEFNQDTTIPPEVDTDDVAGPDGIVFHDQEDARNALDEPAMATLDAGATEKDEFGTNWVDRAIEKQERIRHERIAAWHQRDVPEAPPISSTEVSAPTVLPEAVPPEQPPKSRYRGFGLVVGLALCGYVAYTFASNPEMTAAGFEGIMAEASSLFGQSEKKDLPRVLRLP